MRALAVACVLVAASPAVAHDVSVDVSTALTTTSSNNPRAGNVSLGVSGSFDVADAWTLFGTFVYTRDLATRTPETSSPGSNVFLLSAGAMWLASDHLMTMLVLTGSPPSNQPSATTTTFLDPQTRQPRSVDAVVNGRTWSLGGVWTGSWASNGTGPWESTVDVTAGVNRFDVFQKLFVPDTPKGNLLRQACQQRADVELCALVNGAATPLVQARLAAAYTGTLFDSTDFGLEGSYFLYDKDPNQVGFFSMVLLGRGELGNGVPILPLQLAVRPSIAHRFSRVSLKAAYQAGLYAGGLGFNHLVSLRVTVKLTSAWRLTLLTAAQVDSGSLGLSNPGGNLMLSAMFIF